MKKFLHRTMALLAAMLLLASCAEGGQDKVVAKVNDVEIHNSEFQIWMKTSMNNAMIEIPANYDDLSEDEKTQVEEMREQVLEYLIDERVQLEKAKEEGFDQLSEAELAEVDGYVISQMNSWYDSIAYEVSQEGELGGVEAAEETIKRYNSYIDYSGLNKEYLTEWFGRQIVLTKLQEKYYAQLEPDEAQLRAKYDERVASDKERYTEDPDVYSEDITFSTPLYNPGGYRRVSHILIALTDEQQEEINNLETEGNTAEAETKKAEYLEQAKQKADEVYTELTENGKDFEEAMKEYSSDIDYYGELNQPEGYVFNAANRTNLAPEFVSGGMALAKVGDISSPVKTDFGYHILRFEEDMKEATTAFEDVPSELIDEFKSAIQNDAYESLKAEWRAGMTVEQYLDKVVYPTPTPGPTPSPTAAPTPSAVVTATPIPTTETTPPVEGSTFIPSTTAPSPSAGEETPTGTPDDITPTPSQ